MAPQHHGAVVVGQSHDIVDPAVPGGKRQPVVDAGHELPVVVLGEGENAVKPHRPLAGGSIGVERREHGRNGNALRRVLREGDGCQGRQDTGEDPQPDR